MNNELKNEDRFSELFKQAVDDCPETLDFYTDMTVPESKINERIKSKEEGKRNGRKGIYLKIASFVLLLLVSSSAIAYYISDSTIVQATKNMIMEIRWSSDDDVQVVKSDMGNGELVETFVMNIDDTDKIDKAKKFLPQLYLPLYLPEGFELLNITIELSEDMRYTASQIYMNEEQEYIAISQNYFDKSVDGKIIIRDIDEIIYLNKGGEMYVSYYDNVDLLSGFYIEESDRIDISLPGNNYDILLDIAESLSK